MLEKFLNETLIQTALNQALQLDPQAAEKLQPLNGKRVSIELNLRDKPWVFLIDNARLKIEMETTAMCDVKLKGSLSAFLQLFSERKQASSEDRLYIEGDLYAAQQFQQVMSTLKPNFSYALEQRFGEKLGGILYNALLQTQALGNQAQQQIKQQLQAYFADEAHGFLQRQEFSTHQKQLAQLRATLDKLEAQINTLENI